MKGSSVTQIPVQTTYEKWMQSEGIPIAEAVGGIGDVKEIERKPWNRAGGSGAFIYLQGLKEGGRTGMYVAEIPPGRALEPEKHLYEEIIYVLKGHGATEVWQEGQGKRTFEWGEGSFFSPPLNAWHRLYNGGQEPVLFVAVTTAPLVMDIFHNPEFIFEDRFVFADRYFGEEDYFRESGKVDRKTTGLSIVWDTNFIPDLRTAFIDLSKSTKAAGGRSIGFENSENILGGHLGEWPVGVYHKAHYHGPGAILLGLKSKGYVLMWRKEMGINPFKDGHEKEVIKFDWKEGSVYSPGDGWFHQHFNTGREPARHIAYHIMVSSKYRVGFHHYSRDSDMNVVSMKQGGNMIDFEDEDPAIRRDFEAALRAEGIPCGMPHVGEVSR